MRLCYGSIRSVERCRCWMAWMKLSSKERRSASRRVDIDILRREPSHIPLLAFLLLWMHTRTNRDDSVLELAWTIRLLLCKGISHISQEDIPTTLIQKTCHHQTSQNKGHIIR